MLQYYYTNIGGLMLEIQWLPMIKWLVLLVFLTVIAIRDIKEYRISNNILLFALSVRFGIFIIEFFINKIKLETLLLKSISIICIIIAGVIVNIITHNGIGFGDIKLLAMIALYVNISDIIDIIINSIFVMGVITVILLAIRKKGRKDIIPFAPAILIAVILKGVSYF